MLQNCFSRLEFNVDNNKIYARDEGTRNENKLERMGGGEWGWFVLEYFLLSCICILSGLDCSPIPCPNPRLSRHLQYFFNRRTCFVDFFIGSSICMPLDRILDIGFPTQVFIVIDCSPWNMTMASSMASNLSRPPMPIPIPRVKRIRNSIAHGIQCCLSSGRNWEVALKHADFGVLRTRSQFRRLSSTQ